MDKIKLNYKDHGFTATYYPYDSVTRKTLILVIDDKEQGQVINAAVKYFSESEINILVMNISEDGLHEFPIEVFEKATKWLLENNNRKIGIIGFSKFSMIALAAASYVPDISFTMVYSPCDFITQGYYKGKKGKVKQWLADTSSLSYQQVSLPYVACTLEEELYYESIKEHRFVYEDSIDKEEYYIPVENIKGIVIMFSAKDDEYYNSTKYCKRMNHRFNRSVFPYHVENHIYEQGGHKLYPEGMIEKMSKIYTLRHNINTKDEEYKKTRRDIDGYTKRAIKRWRL